MPEFASKTRIVTVMIVTKTLESMYVCNMLLALVPLHVRSQPTASQDGNFGSRRMQVQGGKLTYRPASVAFTLTSLSVLVCVCYSYLESREIYVVFFNNLSLTMTSGCIVYMHMEHQFARAMSLNIQVTSVLGGSCRETCHVACTPASSG